MAISDQLLSKLACPKCVGDLSRTENDTSLVCKACALTYKIIDDIPVLLVDEAEKQE